MSFTGKWFFVSYKALIDWWGIDAIMGVWWWKIGCNWKDEITLSISNTKLPLLWLTYENIISSDIYVRCYSVRFEVFPNETFRVQYFRTTFAICIHTSIDHIFHFCVARLLVVLNKKKIKPLLINYTHFTFYTQRKIW